MIEWTVDIQAATVGEPSDEALSDAHDRLNSDALLLGPALSVHVPTQTVTAVFGVEAHTIDAAARIAARGFLRGLHDAGVDARLVRLSITPVGDREAVPA